MFILQWFDESFYRLPYRIQACAPVGLGSGIWLNHSSKVAIQKSFLSAISRHVIRKVGVLLNIISIKKTIIGKTMVKGSGVNLLRNFVKSKLFFFAVCSRTQTVCQQR